MSTIKTAEWSSKEWETLKRFVTGGTALGASGGAAVGLFNLLRGLDDDANAQERVNNSIIKVPVLRRKVPGELSSVEEEAAVKSAFLPVPGMAGGMGIGLGAAAGVTAYRAMQKLIQKYKKSESTQRAQDALEGFHASVMREREALEGNATKQANFLQPGERASTPQLATWAMWSGLPLTFLLSAFGSQRLLDRSFPELKRKPDTLDKIVVPEVVEVGPKDQHPQEDEYKKLASAAILPLIVVLGNPHRVKSACLLQPWLDAFRNSGETMESDMTVKRAHMQALGQGADQTECLEADILAGYAMLKSAKLAPAFLACLKAEQLEAMPAAMSAVMGISNRVPEDTLRFYEKKAAAIGSALLGEMVQPFIDAASPEPQVKSATGAPPPLELTLVESVRQMIRQAKRRRKEKPPTPDETDALGVSPNDVSGDMRQKATQRAAPSEDSVDQTMKAFAGV